MRILRCIVITGLTTLLYGCGGTFWAAVYITILLSSLGIVDEPEEPGYIPEPSDPYDCTRGIHPIETDYDARDASYYIIKTIESAIEALPDGTYHEEQLIGYGGGTIIISGVISRAEDEYCGDGCTTSYSNHDIITTMQNYHNYENTIITGDINYSDNRGKSASAELGYITFGNVMITDNGTDISYDETYIIQCDSLDTEVGAIDTILSITASNDSIYLYKLTGQLTTANDTFIFD